MRATPVHAVAHRVADDQARTTAGDLTLGEHERIGQDPVMPGLPHAWALAECR
jgi:hypothetical protein